MADRKLGEFSTQGGILGWTVVSFCLALLSCSFLTDFLVSNRSDFPIEVTYGLREHRRNDVCILPKDRPPAVASTDEIHWWYKRPRWRELPPGSYDFSEERCEYQVRLEPKAVLRVADELDYLEDRFPVVWLRLKTPNGEVFYSGEELRQRFKKHNNSWYELTYP